MEPSASFSEKEFYKRLNIFFEENGLKSKYRIIPEAKLSDYTTDSRLYNRRADFMILKGDYPFMIVEVKNSNKLEYNSREYFQKAPLELELTGADYFAITNLRELLIVEANKQNAFEFQEFGNILNYFTNELDNNEIELIRRAIASSIQEIIKDAKLQTEQELESINNAISILLEDNLFEKISYNSEGRFFHFTNNPELGLEDYENRIFRALLGPTNEQIVCRYTTFDSLFYTLKDKSYRMASDIAMNDRSEIDYADKYIGAYYTPFQSLSKAEMHALNSSFISSCTTIDKEDDLTMYRLYAEDSKGVCLTFIVSQSVQSKNMLIQKISYAIGPNKHPELDFLKKIINKITHNQLIRFRLIYMDVWKHFFKTYDYAIEQEVRLLYLENANNKFYFQQGWIVANPDKILSRYVIFDINDPKFPLKLNKIILGPNFPEAQVNKRQLEVFLDVQKIHNITVENSKIESYRKS